MITALSHSGLAITEYAVPRRPINHSRKTRSSLPQYLGGKTRIFGRYFGDPSQIFQGYFAFHQRGLYLLPMHWHFLLGTSTIPPCWQFGTSSALMLLISSLSCWWCTWHHFSGTIVPRLAVAIPDLYRHRTRLPISICIRSLLPCAGIPRSRLV